MAKEPKKLSEAAAMMERAVPIGTQCGVGSTLRTEEALQGDESARCKSTVIPHC
jgi:hypothetical protein